MTPRRLALIANGFLVITFSCLTLLGDPGFVWLVGVMGASLIFSGWTDFCGFAVIFKRFRFNLKGMK